MTKIESTVDSLIVWGASAGLGPGFTLEATAVRVANDIAELRADGGLPAHVRTMTTVLPQQRVLEIRVEGLSVETDPDRTTIRDVLHALFQITSDHNIVHLDDIAPPLFTQRILLIGADGHPFAALVGAAIGDVETFTPQ